MQINKNHHYALATIKDGASLESTLFTSDFETFITEHLLKLQPGQTAQERYEAFNLAPVLSQLYKKADKKKPENTKVNLHIQYMGITITINVIIIIVVVVVVVVVVIINVAVVVVKVVL